jgi:hypothetical protein
VCIIPSYNHAGDRTTFLFPFSGTHGYLVYADFTASQETTLMLHNCDYLRRDLNWEDLRSIIRFGGLERFGGRFRNAANLKNRFKAKGNANSVYHS